MSNIVWEKCIDEEWIITELKDVKHGDIIRTNGISYRAQADAELFDEDEYSSGGWGVLAVPI